jgi:hypothetical protein
MCRYPERRSASPLVFPDDIRAAFEYVSAEELAHGVRRLGINDADKERLY